jgi:hypothetical protein
MHSKKVGICLALIHNNNDIRNNYLLPNLDALKSSPKLKFKVELLAISSQPEIVPHHSWLAILRSLIYEKLGREWSKYREISPPLILRSLFVFSWRSIEKYLFEKSIGLVWNRNSFIETIVTDKHIRAWNAFMETECEYLICFEDDAVFKEDSAERLNKLFEMLVGRQGNLYIDLAGGCEVDDLKIKQLQINNADGFIHYKKPVTNTACVYLLSRPLVSEYLNQLVRWPCLRLIGIDWLMNKLFILLSKNNFECLCMHAEPPIFKHGSTTGEYVTWQSPT